MILSVGYWEDDPQMQMTNTDDEDLVVIFPKE